MRSLWDHAVKVGGGGLETPVTSRGLWRTGAGAAAAGALQPGLGHVPGARTRFVVGQPGFMRNPGN